MDLRKCSLSASDVAKEEETDTQASFNRTSIVLIVIVILLSVVVVLLLVLLFHWRKRKTPSSVYHAGSKQPPKSNSFSYKCGTACCQKPTNLDYKLPNPTPVSSGTASSKLSSSDNSLKMQPCVLSCNETKPSDSDESLLEKSSFHLGCRESFDDSIKLATTRTSPSALDYEVGVHLSAMDRLRMKRTNRRSAGDELEQTRHLLTATPSLGVTNNNRKSW